MHAPSHVGDSPLIRRLESIFLLTDAERQAVQDLPMQISDLGGDQDIVREGDRPSRCCLFLEGWGCAYKTTADGKRQIVSFTVPGDIPDLHSLHLRVLDPHVGTLQPSKVAFIQHRDLHRLCQDHYRLASAFWRETLIDAAIFRSWMLSLGRREAYGRMAHLLCELLVRLEAVGLARDHARDVPVTQAEFGDALGISTVHVNRVLQQLRAEGTIETRGTRLTVPDWERLRDIGDFDPTYLHLEQGGRAA